MKSLGRPLAFLAALSAVLLCIHEALEAAGPVSWDFKTDGNTEGWEGFGSVAGVISHDGALEITYPAEQLSGAPGLVRNGLNYDAATYPHFLIEIETADAPADGLITGLVWWMQTAGGSNGGVGARKFHIAPEVKPQTVVLDMTGAGDLFDPWAGVLTQLRVEFPWEYDASNVGSAWSNTKTRVQRIALLDAPYVPEYPQTSAFGTLPADYDRRQNGGRWNDLSAEWIRNEQDVLSGFHNMYHPTVIQTDDPEYPFRMWFFGWATTDCNPGYPGCDAIYFARGRSLDEWEVYAGNSSWDDGTHPDLWAPVVTAESAVYDAWHNGDPSIAVHNGMYYMAYSATGFNVDGRSYGAFGDVDGNLYCVMGATSEDGITWTKSAAPLVVYGPEIGGPAGANDEFAYGMYHRPSLLFEEGRWRLWFDYWEVNNVAMGYAEAPEHAFLAGNFEVLFAGKTPLLEEWPNPAVIKVGTTYYAFADPSGYGVGWPGRQIAEAVSDDGITWQIVGYLPPDSDTPACQVPSPTVIVEDRRIWLVVFYACQIGGDPYNWRYDRIRYAKQEITNPDVDGDGLTNEWEFDHGTDPLAANVYCDVNLDGLVNAVDVQLVINAALGLPAPPTADINGDLRYDAVDVQRVINAALGL